MALNSPKSTYDQIYISNYATQNVVDDIKRVAGVGDVFIFGARDYSMRMWLDPASISVLDWRASADGSLIGMLRIFNAIAHLDPPAPWLAR